MTQGNTGKQAKIGLITGLANGTITIDDAFYMQAEIKKEGFQLLPEADQRKFKALWTRTKSGGVKTLSNDERLFMFRCYQKARGDN